MKHQPTEVERLGAMGFAFDGASHHDIDPHFIGFAAITIKMSHNLAAQGAAEQEIDQMERALRARKADLENLRLHEAALHKAAIAAMPDGYDEPDHIEAKIFSHDCHMAVKYHNRLARISSDKELDAATKEFRPQDVVNSDKSVV